MSISTDLASLEIVALIHQSDSMEQVFPRLVKILKRVHHFQWIGIYLSEENQPTLKAASDEDLPYSISRHPIMQVPILDEENEQKGHITVFSRPSIPFDPSDYTSILKIGEEIGRNIV